MSATVYDAAALERAEAVLRALESEHAAQDDWGVQSGIPQASFTLIPSEKSVIDGTRFVTQPVVRYDRAALHEVRDANFARSARNVELPQCLYMMQGASLLDTTDKDDVTDRHPIDWHRIGWATHDQCLPSMLDWRDHGNPYFTVEKPSLKGFVATASEVFGELKGHHGNPVEASVIMQKVTARRRRAAPVAGFRPPGCPRYVRWACGAR